MTKGPHISSVIRNLISFDLTADQNSLLAAFDEFTQISTEKTCLILQGYAGTGKTTMLGAFVRAMKMEKKRTVLLAPTGRAAKVLSLYAKQPASTIHKKIYRRQLTADGGMHFVLAPNLHKHTVFIVDEASMIGDYTLTREGGISARNILEDLIQFVYSGEQCKLILLGDAGQLPPVGAETSPALNLDYMRFHFPELHFLPIQLTQVVRQAEQSGILANATAIRSLDEFEIPRLITTNFTDVKRIHGGDFLEELESAYAHHGRDEVIVLCRSNKRANLYNQHIRGRILWMEEDINGGDLMMVVKNNYKWVEETSPAGFLANGELLRIKRIRKREQLYGHEFITAQIELLDYPEMDEVEVVFNLSAIQAEGPSIARDVMKELFFAIERDYAHERNKRKRYELIMNDRYFSAVQAKFAYAVTCHKAQGGQWECVFIDQGFLPEGPEHPEFHRWLYTAMTRATEKVFLVNFDDNLFPNETSH
jgi:exodeoxyribonuclease V